MPVTKKSLLDVKFSDEFAERIGNETTQEITLAGLSIFATLGEDEPETAAETLYGILKGVYMLGAKHATETLFEASRILKDEKDA